MVHRAAKSSGRLSRFVHGVAELPPFGQPICCGQNECLGRGKSARHVLCCVGGPVAPETREACQVDLHLYAGCPTTASGWDRQQLFRYSRHPAFTPGTPSSKRWQENCDTHQNRLIAPTMTMLFTRGIEREYCCEKFWTKSFFRCFEDPSIFPV